MSDIRAVVACSLLLVYTAPATAATPPAVSTPIMVQQIGGVHPVLAGDGRTHLIYELLLVNQGSYIATVDAITVLDGANDGVLAEMSGPALAGQMRLSFFLTGATNILQPAQSAIAFIDASLAVGVGAPPLLRHRFAVTQAQPAKEGTADVGGITVKPDTGMAPSVTFISSPIPLDRAPPAVLRAPVRGANWVMFRGCCDLATSHRGSTAMYDGALYVPERFAVDFIRMRDDAMLITGPGNAVQSYPQYGETVYAVADGTIVSSHDGEPDQMPGALPDGISAEAAGGNSVMIDIGSGRFAFYAHMQPGSVRFKAGDRVKAGDPIGLVGNSGKTIGPHLHFHMIDAPSPTTGDGLPFVFANFTTAGVVGDDALMLAFQGKPASVDPIKFAGAHVAEYPLNNQILDFGK